MENKTSTQEFDKAKATMVLVNSVGFPIVRHVRLKSITHNPKVRWNDRESTDIRYTQKGKRKMSGSRFVNGNASVAIFEGWHDVDAPESFVAFSGDVFEEMKAQINASQILEIF